MGDVTISQVLLFATPSALAGLAILWWTVHLVGKHRTASVRDGLSLELAMPPEWALDLAQAQFAHADWKPAVGDGTMSWTLRQGMVRYAGVARRQMNALADVLAAADRSYEGPIRTAGHAQEVLDMLQSGDSTRESSAA